MKLRHINGYDHCPSDRPARLTYNPQEIDEMLSSQLTLDDEDAVQAELFALQAEAVSHFGPPHAIAISNVQSRYRQASPPGVSVFRLLRLQILFFLYSTVGRIGFIPILFSELSDRATRTSERAGSCSIGCLRPSLLLIVT